jgi:hypothetical protein
MSLASAVEPLLAKKVEHADKIYTLIQIARGQGASVVPWLQTRADEWKKPEPGGQPNQAGRPSSLSRRGELNSSEALLAHLAMDSPATQDAGEALARAWSKRRSRPNSAG